MTDTIAPKSPTEVLKDLVARRKAAANGFSGGAGRESERTAAARSAAKSKPALRK
jgi:hypothetical protein